TVWSLGEIEYQSQSRLTGCCLTRVRKCDDSSRRSQHACELGTERHHQWDSVRVEDLHPNDLLDRRRICYDYLTGPPRPVANCGSSAPPLPTMMVVFGDVVVVSVETV